MTTFIALQPLVTWRWELTWKILKEMSLFLNFPFLRQLMVQINTDFWLEDTMAQQATQWQFRSKYWLLTKWKHHCAFKWKLIGTARPRNQWYWAIVSLVFIIISIIVIVITIFCWIKYIAQIRMSEFEKRGRLISVSAHEAPTNCSRMDGMPVDRRVTTSRISSVPIYTRGWGETLNEKWEIAR